MLKILILYYSQHGNTRQLARHIARGVEQIAECEAVLRTVPTLENGQLQQQSTTDPLSVNKI